jgi:hypothetical protein
MALFGNILEKLGLGKKGSAPPPRSTSTVPPRSTSTAPSQSTAGSSAGASTSASPERSARTPGSAEPTGAVDVTAQLEKLAAANPQKLNWRTSIVDLLKLLGIDSSLAARKELATELGCPPELMGDSAQMNTWLHKTVLARVAENGGKVPQELLH